MIENTNEAFVDEPFGGSHVGRRPSRPRRAYKPRGLRTESTDLFDPLQTAKPTGQASKAPSIAYSVERPTNRTRRVAGVLVSSVVLVAAVIGYISWPPTNSEQDNIATADPKAAVDIVVPDVVTVVSEAPREMNSPITDDPLLSQTHAAPDSPNLEPAVLATPAVVSAPPLVADNPPVNVVPQLEFELTLPSLGNWPQVLPVSETAASTPVQPTQLADATPPTAFICETCQTFDPQMQNVTLNIHATQGISAAEIALITDKTRNIGIVDMSTVAAEATVSYTQARFFHADDADAAQTLAERLGATVVDFSWITPTPPPGMIDLMLARQDPAQ